MQILINTLVQASLYLLVALSFFLIYKPTKTFHMTLAFIISFGAYLVYFFNHLLKLNLFFSVFMALGFAAIFGVLYEKFVYRKFSQSKDAKVKLLVLSLGLYTILLNLLAMSFGDGVRVLYKSKTFETFQVLGAHISATQLAIVVVSLTTSLVVTLFWYRSKAGKAIRAIAGNIELSQVFGIPYNYYMSVVFIFSSVIGAVVGILVGFDIGVSPNSGFKILLYGIVVMIIGGIETLTGLLAGALILATTQNLTAYYFDTRWTDAVTFCILILFLMVRPFGVSGRKIKKVRV